METSITNLFSTFEMLRLEQPSVALMPERIAILLGTHPMFQ